jgi:hypothetical protein
VVGDFEKRPVEAGLFIFFFPEHGRNAADPVDKTSAQMSAVFACWQINICPDAAGKEGICFRKPTQDPLRSRQSLEIPDIEQPSS